jgi:CNT family concentrative nucleoside transporter
MAASVMAAPGAVIFAKMMSNPGRQQRDGSELITHREKHARLVANGTTDGVKLAVKWPGKLLAFLALLAMINFA